MSSLEKNKSSKNEIENEEENLNERVDKALKRWEQATVEEEGGQASKKRKFLHVENNGYAEARPFNADDLRKLVKTFKPSTWFGKPECVSAIECVRFGYINVENDTIQCPCCKVKLKFECNETDINVEEAAAKEFKAKLSKSHHYFCPWLNNFVSEEIVADLKNKSIPAVPSSAGTSSSTEPSLPATAKPQKVFSTIRKKLNNLLGI